jgi:hypothetical protein
MAHRMLPDELGNALLGVSRRYWAFGEIRIGHVVPGKIQLELRLAVKGIRPIRPRLALEP